MSKHAPGYIFAQQTAHAQAESCQHAAYEYAQSHAFAIENGHGEEVDEHEDYHLVSLHADHGGLMRLV